MEWYEVENIAEIDSPALLWFPDRIGHNIRTMIAAVNGNPARLMPHVKTHKSEKIVGMQLQSGIQKFKCATVSELEMCLTAGAPEVLLAYQLNTPKLQRFLRLVQLFPQARISSLVDNMASARRLDAVFGAAGLIARAYIDVNTGQDRTGFPVEQDLLAFARNISEFPNLELAGLHIYDGHIRGGPLGPRKKASDEAFAPVQDWIRILQGAGFRELQIIAGGSPSFLPSSLRNGVICSPGTTLLWDWNYASTIPELDFQWAAVVASRVISKPASGVMTTDLGHKSVSGENPLVNRVRFLNLPQAQPTGQSEEHLVLKTDKHTWKRIEVGRVLYGVPFHVCPTVALYDQAHIIRKNQWDNIWKITARARKISL